MIVFPDGIPTVELRQATPQSLSTTRVIAGDLVPHESKEKAE